MNLPDINDLPDLSEWLIVEVVTIEEAAMLFGAIDPADYESIEAARPHVHAAQYRRAFLCRRAFSEAVCIGSLGYVEAWESRPVGYDGEEIPIKLDDILANPEIQLLIPRMTRVRMKALIGWAKNKGLLSIRSEAAKRQVGPHAHNQKPVTEPLAFPGYKTKAMELLITHVEENLAGVPESELPTPKQQREWLESQASHLGLSGREADAVYTVARPESIKSASTSKAVRPKNK